MNRSERREARFQRCLDRITEVMKNYPDGRITDLLGANTLYALMNQACRFGKQAGYTDDQIAERVLAARQIDPSAAEPAEPVTVTVAGDDIVFDP